MAVPLGIVLVWLGYSTFYYGYSRLKGGSNRFVDLVWPGRYTYSHDAAGDGQSAAVPGSQQQGPNATNAPGILPNAPQSPTPNPTNPSGAV